jgi:hypothetical protein
MNSILNFFSVIPIYLYELCRILKELISDLYTMILFYSLVTTHASLAT